MARILFTLPRFHTNMWFAVRRMREDGHIVELLVNSAGGTEDYTYATPKVVGQYPPREDVDRMVGDFSPDIMIIRNAVALSRRVARAGRKRNIPALRYNLSAVDDRPSPTGRLKLAYKRLPKNRITPVRRIVPSHSPDPYAHYLPWPVGRLPANGSVREAGERLRVLLVGKLSLSRKNQLRLIETLERAGAEKYLTLTLIGTMAKPESANAAEIDVAANKPWIKLEHARPFREMAHLYASHDVCILPSFNEPLGAAPVEAMAYGVVPFISSQCGSAGYLTHDQDGIIFDPNCMDDAAKALIELSKSKTKLDRLRQGTLQTYKEHLSEDAFSQRFETLLKKFLQK